MLIYIISSRQKSHVTQNDERKSPQHQSTYHNDYKARTHVHTDKPTHGWMEFGYHRIRFVTYQGTNRNEINHKYYKSY